MATPTPAALDQEAAKLRNQAAKLEEEQADRVERTVGQHGGRFDEANRAATAARANANEAVRQANGLREGAQGLVNEATDLEEQAARLAGSSNPADRARADDLRAEAQQALAKAAGRSDRAEHAERTARQKLQEAERADRDARQIRGQSEDEADAGLPLGKAADALEQKATELEEAAGDLRQANKALTAGERDKLVKQAEGHLGKADAIKPDYTQVDVDIMVRSGIPVSHKPGAELMDLPSSPQTSAPTGNDTDLMNPDGTIGPATPSPAPAPAANDTDLMRPDGTTGPATAPSGDDTDLMRPDGTSSLPVDPLADPVTGVAGPARLAAPIVGLADPLADPVADSLADPLGTEGRREVGDFDSSTDDVGASPDPAVETPDTSGIEAGMADVGPTDSEGYAEPATDSVGDDPMADPVGPSYDDSGDVGGTGAEVAYAGESYDDAGGDYGADSYADAATSGEYGV